MHWTWGGAAIAVITLLLLYFGNRRLGISTGFEVFGLPPRPFQELQLQKAKS
jgi:hypothetical protein